MVGAIVNTSDLLQGLVKCDIQPYFQACMRKKNNTNAFRETSIHLEGSMHFTE